MSPQGRRSGIAVTDIIVLFCSLAALDPRVGHNMDVLSPFIPVLCHSDSSTEDNVLMLSIQAVRGLLACVHLALFLALSLSPGTVVNDA